MKLCITHCRMHYCYDITYYKGAQALIFNVYTTHLPALDSIDQDIVFTLLALDHFALLIDANYLCT